MAEIKECRERICNSTKFRVVREDNIVWELKCRECGTVHLVYKTLFEPTLLELGWDVT